ncbi:hypothetical protein GGF46_004665 [Coemansia sp. RSA 552]|nr:hypothetical protein GGF46_004665 [Coemansia sp. RSA 552]
MEDEISKVVDSVYREDPLVTGVIVVDDSGLCLENKGVPEEASGLVAALASRSEAVLPPVANQGVDSSPVVQIEAESLTVVVKRVFGVTVGIFKSRAKGKSPL